MKFKLKRIGWNLESSCRYYGINLQNILFEIFISLFKIFVGVFMLIGYFITIIISFLVDIFVSGFIKCKWMENE